MSETHFSIASMRMERREEYNGYNSWSSSDASAPRRSSNGYHHSDRASVPAQTLLSARGLVGLPVRMPDGFGGMDTAGEVREVYLTPDRKRLLGLAVWRADNVPGGGELLWLSESLIQVMSVDEIRIAGWNSLREFLLEERAGMTARRLEMLRGRPLGADANEVHPVDCLLEPALRCILSYICGDRPATLLPSPSAEV